MADRQMTAGMTGDNGLREIRPMRIDLHGRLQEVLHLIDAIEDAAWNLASDGTEQESGRRAIDAIQTFSKLAKRTVQEAADLGAPIETQIDTHGAHAMTAGEENSAGLHLYAKWRRAAAQWDLARWAPEFLGGDLPADVDQRHLTAEHTALIDYLRTSAANLGELARKLQVFHKEGGAGFTEAFEIVEALAKDARRLASLEVTARRHRRN